MAKILFYTLLLLLNLETYIDIFIFTGCRLNADNNKEE